MKKVAIVGALLVLAGCAEVENYNDVVKTPAPAGLEGYWQSKGPQRKLVSPEAIASLVVTKEGDTLDCRQWQRVIALPGKLTMLSDDLTNVTVKRELYEIERDGNTLEYDGMTLQTGRSSDAGVRRRVRKNAAADAAAVISLPGSALPPGTLITRPQ
ncbi:lipoprotein [Salmonella enterica subsp. enterica]|uniref:Lipoprotein n=1 Tax=Salmonella enterica I TaxID=59201 RepID=A0A447N8L4_SALET|nr:lipoprotein [Salmonella enterica subsp. enterica]